METRGYKFLVAVLSLLLLLVFIAGCVNGDNHAEPTEAAPGTGNGSLKCYVCNSLYDTNNNPDNNINNNSNANCEKNLQPSQIEECPPDSVGCWKIIQIVPYNEGKLKAHKRIIRKCANQSQDTQKCIRRSRYGTSMNYCFCNSTSLCNESWQLDNNPIMTIFSELFLILIMKAFY